jgi:large subunit ribosomal protein L16
MFLEPKKFKYKKIRKGKLAKLEFKTNKLIFGTIGLKAASSGLVHARHLEACRQAISRKIKRKGKLWIRIFPYLPITSKPSESRMGKGKGSISHWAAKVKSGTVLFELCSIQEYKIVLDALKTGGHKLPIKSKVFF